MRGAARALALLLLLGSVSAGSAGCKHARAATGDAAVTSAIPEVTDESTGLLFTWLDEKGEFHTGEKVSDVPMVGRDQVRVMDPEHDDGDPDRIFIVDLRTAGAGGKYPTRTMKRSEYDALAEGLRKKTGPTLGSVASHPEPPASGNAPTQTSPGAIDPSGAVRPSVIVYGAEWCHACKEAMAYMKKKGISFVDKDIEKDEGAAREMASKLSRAGIRSRSIPILDVKGKMIVGFSKESLDQALGATL